MELIKPSEVSARILTLLDESDEWVILVSPFVKISKWYKLLRTLNELNTRTVSVDIYVRDDPENSATYDDLDQLELPYKKIPRLHSKIYLNEKYGIVTSMNLLLSSEVNSLEIGLATETAKEYEDLLGYYHRYIHAGEPVHSNILADQLAADLKKVMNSLSEEFRRNPKNLWTWLSEDNLHICSPGNNYNVSINDGKLQITALIKIPGGSKKLKKQQTTILAKKISEKVRDLTVMKVDAHQALNPGIFELSAKTHHKLKNNSSDRIRKDEVDNMVRTVQKFIDVTDNLVVQEAQRLKSLN